MTARRLSFPSSFVPERVLRIVTVVLVGSLVGALSVTLLVLPMRDFFQQRTAMASRSREFEALADANEQLQIEIREMKSPEGIVAAARSQLGYVFPREQRVQIVSMPDLPTTLPTSWPYSMVSSILAVRAAALGASGGALAPLAP